MITSSLRRFLKLGGLMGRVGGSVAADRAANLLRSDPASQIRQTENLVRNATRIVETLGEMKGAAMKVGQMLSLHEAMLPPEVAEVLRALQREAPRVPAEVMEYEIRGALPDFDELFEALDFEAFAAASIGQVHLGRLRDGREVAVKIQYPLIDEIVRADLKNLKRLFASLFALIFEIDFEPFWRELHDRLLEELDYTHEAANIRRMAQLHAEVPEIVIPEVVDEATTRNVLTMEYLEGIPPAEACSPRFDSELRDRWGAVLYEFLIRGLLDHRFLHADPNLANFAFLDDGRIIVYDFGCIKKVPLELARGVAEVMIAATEEDFEGIPDILQRMGIFKLGDTPLPRELTDPYLEMLAPIVRADPLYTFGEDPDLYHRVFELGLANFAQSTDVHFPEDMIFIDRTYSGHFGNLCKLEATGPWREIVLSYAGQVLEPGGET
jgi:predicted unusual protein kinase regulating ubiquinone biosynthesis (AarF/ABC1/UbiB family)